MLVAQCTGSAPCELPTGLPWYLGLVLAAIWLAVVGAVWVGRRLLHVRRERRRPRGDERRAIGRASSRDVEPW